MANTNIQSLEERGWGRIVWQRRTIMLQVCVSHLLGDNYWKWPQKMKDFGSSLFKIDNGGKPPTRSLQTKLKKTWKGKNNPSTQMMKQQMSHVSYLQSLIPWCVLHQYSPMSVLVLFSRCNPIWSLLTTKAAGMLEVFTR